MELPKNITQVGETDRNCKIYVEDYVVSYMRQMNAFAEDKEIAIALYGKMSVEQEITYCFVYGACMVQSINREIRHLSQAQNQEVERMRRRYFPEQSFLGYQILNGDLIEGFRIYDQNSCRYVKGYACFFEKNDTMLAYMLEARGEEIQPEKVEQDKYDMVKKRQEERRRQFEERRQPLRRAADEKEKEEKKEKQFKVAPFLALAACCLTVLILWDRGDVAVGMKKYWNVLSAKANDLLFAQKEEGEDDEAILIEPEEIEEEYQAVMSTLVTEDKLVDAILEENEKASEELLPEVSEEISVIVPETEDLTEQEPEASEEPPQILQEEEETQPVVKQPETYVIQAGDTLIGISNRICGSDSLVSSICELNDISDPNNIQIGQKILLP